jgi:glycosyltransferase involved in cell wall biosynthesis
MKITFILPKLTENPTGGGKVVYQYANSLAVAGYSVEVLHPESLFLWRLKRSLISKLLSLCYDILKMATRLGRKRYGKVRWIGIHPDVKITVVPTLFQRYIPDADIVVASLWRTAEFVEKYSSDKGEKFYLIQHYETWSGPEDRVNQTLKSGMNKIVISRWLEQLVKDLSGDFVHHVPNSVDHDEFYLTSPISDRNLAISMLYSPHSWKGASDGILALQQAKISFPGLTAILFGTSSRPDFIPAWITYINNPTPKFLREEIYNHSAVFLCPSWSEGWGLPVLEAMACGCAVVTADNGGIRDFVEDGGNGFIVPAKQPEELGRSLMALLDNPQKRILFAERSLELAETFTLAKSAGKLRDVFESRQSSIRE